jgi:ribonuclease HI
MEAQAQETREIYVWTDGGASGNPGPLRYGFIAFEKDEETQELVEKYRCTKQVGTGTNNQAEMLAVHEAIDWLEKRIDGHHYRVVMHTDSLLVYNWIGDMWKCNFPHIVAIRHSIWEKMGRIMATWQTVEFLWKHVKREENMAHEVGGW